MKLEVIQAVYYNKVEIKPIGKAISNRKGEYIKCLKCNNEIQFLEFETGRIRSTQC